MECSARGPARRRVRLWIVGVTLCILCGACGTPGPKGRGGPTGNPTEEEAQRRQRLRSATDDRITDTSDFSQGDRKEFREAWVLFVRHDDRWPAARDRWLGKGGAAPYILAENLFRYFWSASRVNRRDEIARVSEEAARVGEPATAYFAKALVTDRWPLSKPVTVEVFNPDNINKPIVKTFRHYDIDDMTRQHAAYVLATIGSPAVPVLSSPRVLNCDLPSARRLAAYALGAIATDEAVAALGRILRTQGDWQGRGAAAKGLGFALRKNPAARPLLEAALEDPDEFVRRKAKEGLEGRTKIEF